MHDKYGWFEFKINSSDDSITIGGAEEGSLDTFFLSHGIVLYICWGFFGVF